MLIYDSVFRDVHKSNVTHIVSQSASISGIIFSFVELYKDVKFVLDNVLRDGSW